MANKEMYYLDYFNGYPSSEGMSKSFFMDNTMRLYVKDFTKIKSNGEPGNTNRLILVAPLLSPPELSGQNSWEAAGSSFKDLVTEAWNEAEGNIAKAKEGFLNLIRTSATQTNQAARRAASYIMDSPIKSLKRYAGTEVAIPSTITATYYSSDAKDFEWFEGGYFNHTEEDTTNTGGMGSAGRGVWDSNKNYNFEAACQDKPLKYIARKLIPICLGYIDAREDRTQSTGDTGLFNSIKLKPPSSYATPPHTWSTTGIDGTFTLHIGSTISIEGLLPSSIEIKPSKLLTVTGDYYYMTVTINLTQGRQFYSNELISWIDNDADKDNAKIMEPPKKENT